MTLAASHEANKLESRVGSTHLSHNFLEAVERRAISISIDIVLVYLIGKDKELLLNSKLNDSFNVHS